MSFSGSVWFLVPGGTHGTLSFMARVLARVGFLVPGGTHGTLSFMVWYLLGLGFMCQEGHMGHCPSWLEY